MSQFTIYSILITIISIFGLVYTYKIGQNQKENGRYDTKVNDHVHAHPFTLNPVFITYIVTILLSIGYLIYTAMRAGSGL